MIYLISLILALSASAIEAISYPGFIMSHLYFPAYLLYLFSIMLSLTYKNTIKQTKYIYPLGVIITLSYVILVFLEKVNYPNFVYTITHINLFTYQLFIALLWFHIFVIKQSAFVRNLLLATIIFVGVDGAGRTLALSYIGLHDLARDPLATYGEKMTRAYPGFYPAMQEIKKLTPEGSTILIPPQGNPWEMEGNAAMVTYFLYPRHVENLDIKKISNLPSYTYLLIAKGSWRRVGDTDYGWPKVPVAASRVWNIDIEKDANKEYARDYDPNFDKWDWGLIEVKNE